MNLWSLLGEEDYMVENVPASNVLFELGFFNHINK